MGLTRVTEEDLEDISSNSNDSSSSSSGGTSSSGGSPGKTKEQSPFPKYDRRCPHAVVNENGEFTIYPETPVITWRKEWYTSDWEHDLLPSEWAFVWWSEQQFEMDTKKMKVVKGLNLKREFKKRPEEAKSKLHKSRSEYHSMDRDFGVGSDALNTRSCACCGDRLNLYQEDYEEFDNNVVCAAHTAKELKDAGVL